MQVSLLLGKTGFTTGIEPVDDPVKKRLISLNGGKVSRGTQLDGLFDPSLERTVGGLDRPILVADTQVIGRRPDRVVVTARI